jgi:deoxyribonuclease V
MIEPLEPVSHPWEMTEAEAVALQKRLAPLVAAARPIALADVQVVAAIDVSYDDDAGEAYVAVVAYGYPLFNSPLGVKLGEVGVTLPSVFPYIPGLLSFREAPVALAALAALDVRPDLLLCDGHGTAHPRRFGLACHLGLLTGLPSVGCAKSWLLGDYEEPARTHRAYTPLVEGGEVVGAALRTHPGSRPVYVSPGYRLTLEQAIQVVNTLHGGHRLPEPAMAAHRLASAVRRAAFNARSG